MQEKSLRVLEFYKIREMLVEKAASQMGKERCASLVPESDFAAMAALNVKTGCPVPASLSVLNTLPVRFNTVIEPAAIRDAALK